MALKVNTDSLRPNELEAVYAISRVVAERMDIDDALDAITQLAREVFIFDNAVIYFVHQSDELEPVFARAIGRGRSTPSDLSWGDIAAREVIRKGVNFTHQSQPSPDADRLDRQYFLGLPMLVSGNIVGALVFIRFGGPKYTESQINLAEFIVTHISHLFERQRLVARIANLEAERMLARLQEDFIAMVSHELNTPLGFIKGYTTTLLRDDTEWDEETRIEFLNIIDEEADRLSELIDNLLDSSRLQAGTMALDLKPTYLDELMGNEVKRLQKRYNNLNLSLECKAKNVSVLADRRRLVQVLDNLVSNASKYAPNSDLNITIDTKDNQAVIMVSDTGPGIPEDHLKHIFDRFYRVPERSAGVRGSGLGLFICQRLIRAQKGEIGVSSKLNQGTTFTIKLATSDNNTAEENK